MKHIVFYRLYFGVEKLKGKLLLFTIYNYNLIRMRIID